MKAGKINESFYLKMKSFCLCVDGNRYGSEAFEKLETMAIFINIITKYNLGNVTYNQYTVYR